MAMQMSLEVDSLTPFGLCDGTAALADCLQPHGRPRAIQLSHSQIPDPLKLQEIISVCHFKLQSCGVTWYTAVGK